MKIIVTAVLLGLSILSEGCSTPEAMAKENTHSIQKQNLEEMSLICAYMAKLTSDNRKVRNRAQLDFKSLSDSSTQHLVELLIDAFQEGDANLQGRVRGCWARIGPRAVPAVPLLINQTRDPSPDVRQGATFTLGKIGPAASNAIPSIIELLKDSDSHVRANAASALRAFGSQAKDATPYLIVNLEDSYYQSRESAACALGTIGPPAKEAVPHLIGVLEKGTVQGNAVWALGQIGPQAVQAVPVIVRMLGHDRREVRINAIDALGHIRTDHKPTIQKLVGLVDGKDSVLSHHVVNSLESIGKPAVFALIELVAHKSAHIRVAAIQSLGNLGHDAHNAIPILRRALDDHEPGGPISCAMFAPRTAADWAKLSLEKIMKEQEPNKKMQNIVTNSPNSDL
jgi:HEAT repeat protein